MGNKKSANTPCTYAYRRIELRGKYMLFYRHETVAAQSSQVKTMALVTPYDMMTVTSTSRQKGGRGLTMALKKGAYTGQRSEDIFKSDELCKTGWGMGKER
jgi:hypothetical protein